MKTRESSNLNPYSKIDFKILELKFPSSFQFHENAVLLVLPFSATAWYINSIQEANLAYLPCILDLYSNTQDQILKDS